MELQNDSMSGNVSRTVVVVGDKVLIKPEAADAQTPTGLYLPPGVAEKEHVATGHVVNVGPGYPTLEPVGDPEGWSGRQRNPLRYVPLQAEPGDYAVFLRRDGIEVEIDGKQYLIVPHTSILLLIRERLPLP